MAGILAASLTMSNAAERSPSVNRTGDQVATAYDTQIRFGDQASESAASVTVSGSVTTEVLSTEMGGFHDRYRVRTLQGLGASLLATVAAPSKGQPLLVEIEEIHDRRPDAFGYLVLANGREVYFRSYQEYGAGPNHFFVQIPAEIIGQNTEVRLTIRNEGATPFSLGRLWTYQDFTTKVVAAEQVLRPMGLFVFDKFLAKPEQRRAYEGLTCYGPVGAMSFVSYGGSGVEKQNHQLLEKLASSAQTGIPLILEVNGTGWGGKPSGPDGQGGDFSDLRYSAVSYDQVTREWRASWPNMWGNMAWPTKRDPQLNAYLERRFDLVMSGFQRQIDLLNLDRPYRTEFIREWGLGGGEVSSSVIAKAKQEGVTLDPTDGLSVVERRWMEREGVDAWNRYADRTRRVVERDAVAVDRGTVRLPEAQQRDFLYSQPDFLSDTPMNDPRWSGGQQGMVDGFWSSGEMGKGTEYREIAMNDYLKARGKLALVNLERTILKQDFTALRRHYESGFRFVALFNSEDGDASLIHKVDGIDDEPAQAPVHREPSLLDVMVSRDGQLGPAAQIHDQKNVRIHNNVRMAVGDITAPGIITYRIDAPTTTFQSGLNLHVDGRVSSGVGNRIEILAGTDPQHLDLISHLTAHELPCPDHWTPWMTSEYHTELGTAMIGARTWYVRLVFHADAAPDAAFLLSLHIGTRWSRHSGHVGSNPFTVKQVRAHQLWIQERALAELTLQHYQSLAGEDATSRKAAAQIESGWYHSAYRYLCGAMAEILPARYAIRGFGQLGRQPILIHLEHEDEQAIVTVERVSAEGLTVAFGPVETPRRVTLTWTGSDPARTWLITREPGNRFRIFAGSTLPGATRAIVADGQVTAEMVLEATPPPTPRRLPSRFIARCLAGDAKQITFDLQNLDMMGFEKSITLELAPGASVERQCEFPQQADAKADQRPQPMDRLELSLDDRGQVTKLVATYGRDQGCIRAFHPPVLIGDQNNGSIELDNGNTYLIDYQNSYGTRFDLVGLQGPVVNYQMSYLGTVLKPGLAVDLTYSPSAITGGTNRLLTLHSNNRVVFSEDYETTTNDAWRDRAVSVEGLAVTLHKPEPNYLYNVEKRLLRPNQPFVPGSIVYRITSEQPLGEAAVEFTARAFEDSSRVEFQISDDGSQWTSVGCFDNTWQSSYSQSLAQLPPNLISLGSRVAGKRKFFLKMLLVTGDADQRFCVGRIAVRAQIQ
jgi:hypothetical protein